MPSKGVHEFNVITKSKQRLTVYKNNSYNGGTVGASQTAVGTAPLTAVNSSTGSGPTGNTNTSKILVCNTVGEWATEIDKVERNDKTVRSGGRANPFDFDIEVSASDFDDVRYMHEWYAMALDSSRYTRGDAPEGVDKDAYRAVMREYYPHIAEASDIIKVTALDVWISSEKLPDYAMDSNDEAVFTYSCSASGIYYEPSSGVASRVWGAGELG